MTRWCINGRFLTQPITGVQRYAREVVAALDHRLHALPQVAGHPIVELLVPSGTKVDLRLTNIRTRNVGHLQGHAWEQFELPLHARGVLLSLCNTGPLAYRNHIVTIHDVNTREFPESYTPAFRLMYRILHPALGITARTIATVSNFSASQLTRYGIAPANKIIVAPNGCDHATRWLKQPSTEPCLSHTSNTVVALGSTAPHKNLNLLINLADQLAAHGLQLAIIGNAQNHVFQKGAQSTEHPAITYLGRLDDNAMATVLSHALCLAFPSWTEGFGLPPIEAMAIGCPVVVSDRASIPEICGPAALYAAPDDPSAWIKAFLALRDDPAIRQNMIRAGHLRARNYSWQATAQLYIDAATTLSASPRSNIVKTRVPPPLSH